MMVENMAESLMLAWGLAPRGQMAMTSKVTATILRMLVYVDYGFVSLTTIPALRLKDEINFFVL